MFLTNPARTLRVARFVPCTEAEGPHRRFALWVQGCSLRCPGCCNPGLFDLGAGSHMTLDDLARALTDAARRLHVEGLSVIGGEPLEQAAGVTALAAHARTLGLGVIVYSGYEPHELPARPGFGALWHQIDTLVTGRYDRTRPDRRRAFVGSTNQRLLHRTPRYADPTLWRGRQAAELRIHATGEVSAVGMPRDLARLARTLRSSRPEGRQPLSSQDRMGAPCSSRSSTRGRNAQAVP